MMYLRGRVSVVVSGVAPELERTIRRVVTREEVVDLCRAFDEVVGEPVWREVRRVRAGDREG